MAVRKEKVKQQFTEAVAGVLEPGEQLQAGAYGPSGPNPFFAAGLFGVLGMLLFGVRYYYVAVTDRRVVFLKSSFWTARPAGFGWADPRGSVTISEVETDAKLWNHLKYAGSSGKTMRMNFHVWWRDETKQLVAALGGSGQAAPASPPAS